MKNHILSMLFMDYIQVIDTIVTAFDSIYLYTVINYVNILPMGAFRYNICVHVL